MEYAYSNYHYIICYLSLLPVLSGNYPCLGFLIYHQIIENGDAMQSHGS